MSGCQRRKHRLFRRTEGAVAVEFALILSVLLLLVCGIIDFGNVYYQLHNVNEAAREGARLAAVDTNLANAVSDATSFIHTNYGNLLTVSVTPSPPVSGSNVTVTVSNSVTINTPIISAFFPSNPFTVTGKTVMRVE